MASTASVNRYLTGIFAPVPDEITVTDLPVEGTIPRDLRGRLLRNGPNPIAPDPLTYHWFLGDGMVHGIHLRDGKALSYQNRWVRTDQASAALGEKPATGQPDDVFFDNPANTAIVTHGGRILCLVEVALPTEIGRDLDTIGRYDFGGALRSPMTAHPKVDPVSGHLFFFGYNMFGPPYLRFHDADAKGDLIRTIDIDIPGPVMIHDFAITESRVIFYDLPVVFDFELVGRQPFPATWKPEHGARLGVMPRDGGVEDVRWIEIEPCYVFHTLNAFDDGDRVVVDVVRHPEMFARDLNGPGGPPPVLHRWTIDPAAEKVLDTRLDDRAQEFPRVADNSVGRPYRYGYSTGLTVDDDYRIGFGGLLKHDLGGGPTETRDFGPGMVPSEGVFVAGADSRGEDEGWLLSVVYDRARDASDLVILDSTDFRGGPAAVIHLPRRIPYGFHGAWVADET